ARVAGHGLRPAVVGEKPGRLHPDVTDLVEDESGPGADLDAVRVEPPDHHRVSADGDGRSERVVLDHVTRRLQDLHAARDPPPLRMSGKSTEASHVPVRERAGRRGGPRPFTPGPLTELESRYQPGKAADREALFHPRYIPEILAKTSRRRLGA